ncbi:3',5'-cyclic-AMP phosphodiesterase [Thiosocius teredinicola]|uniref:3',5'-cyclic-AMP phosphodiesterase n=1 Tax=Thiosocius teredinicola TaxID=1973002 RepID=UPI000990B6F1
MTSSFTGTGSDSNLRSAEFPAGTLRVLQLTDTHLYANPVGTLLGINTLDSFQRVIDHFRNCHWPLDLLLATGDLVHDASPEGYRRVGEMLARFDVPVFCLPGNHDVPNIMRKHLRNDGVHTDSIIDHGEWRFIMLDSVKPGAEGGHLSDHELDLLDKALAGADRHTLVCMHHQPVNVGSAWIDTMAIDNPDPLFEIIDRYSHVRGILWGHIHQTFEGRHRNVRLMASPSTCVQFAPAFDNFKVDEEPPGFRLLALLPDGTIRSEVVRIDDVPQGLELASSGY